MEAMETTQNEAPVSNETEDSSSENAKSNPEAFDAKKIGDPLTPAEKIKLKFKHKIDGQEIEEELDEDQIRRERQRWLASDKRFQEAAAERKKNEAYNARGKDKYQVRDILKEWGHDPRALAEELLTEEIEFQMMSPEKKRIYELEREKFFRDKSDKERAALERQGKESEVRARLTGQLQGEVIEALKGSTLPQTPQMVSRMAQQMRVHLQRGIDISVAEAAQLVQKELIEEGKANFPKMGVTKLKEILGQDMVNALLKDSLAQVKDPVKRADKRPSDSVSERVIEKPTKGYITQNEFEKHMQRFRGKK